MYFPRFDWPRIDCPAARFPLSEYLDEVIALEREALSQIDQAIGTHGHDIACLLIEPIQGEGGDNHFRPEFLAELRERADRHEFMLIYDEVQTGMGLTGDWWAWQQLGVAPDIFCFGKKSQVCGIACSKRIDEVEENVFRVSSRLNSTWGGNLVDMVRCTRYLEIMKEENTLENVKSQGKLLLEGLLELQERFSSCISNTRGRGLMCAFDLPDGETRDATLRAVYEEGAIVLPCGCNSIRFRPPLNISGAELETALHVLGKAFAKVL
jgi:L-lysine 6-transaminase